MYAHMNINMYNTFTFDQKEKFVEECEIDEMGSVHMFTMLIVDFIFV